MIKVTPGRRTGMGSMKCPSCESDWPANVKFCGTCGTKLVSAGAGGLPPVQAKVNEQLSMLLPQIVIAFGDKVAVRSMAPVAIGSSLAPEMMKFLLNRNAGFIFGAFGVDPKGTVGFGHTILASSMDVDELGASVRTVLQVADEYDDQIVARWGGKTARQMTIDQILPAHIIRMLRVAK